EPGVLDVAEDPFPGAAGIPHRPERHRTQDLRRAREQTVRVFQLIVARAEPEIARHAQEPGGGAAAPRRVAAALLLAADVDLRAEDQPSPVDREVAGHER